MRITYKGDYALKTILGLSLHYNQGLVNINDLATRSDVPVKFLEQILLELKKGGFVDSKRGTNGGYFLAKAPGQIKVGDVVRFIDGPIEPIACASKETEYAGCLDTNTCVFRELWSSVAYATSRIIDSVTFEDLVNKVRSRAKTIVYQI